jgi:hypothetical protein
MSYIDNSIAYLAIFPVMCGPLSGALENSGCISELYDMKISSFGVTQHFADEVDWILDLLVSV